MGGLSSLWRVEGSLPVPPSADDEGLLSRVADIFEQQGFILIEESRDRVRFTGAGERLARLADRFPWLFGRIEVRRYGTRGWRFLQFELPALQLLVLEAVGAGIFIAGLLADWGGLSLAYPATIAICVLMYFWQRYRLLNGTKDLIGRAFET